MKDLREAHRKMEDDLYDTDGIEAALVRLKKNESQSSTDQTKQGIAKDAGLKRADKVKAWQTAQRKK